MGLLHLWWWCHLLWHWSKMGLVVDLHLWWHSLWCRSSTRLVVALHLWWWWHSLWHRSNIMMELVVMIDLHLRHLLYMCH